MIKLLDHQNISDKAYNVLLEMIIGGRFESGERLIEEQLAENLGVSRTPLRDAINRLAKDGLVSIQPRKGASVQRFSIDDVMEVYDIRIALEGLATGLAAAKIDLNKLEKLKVLFASRNKIVGNLFLSQTSYLSKNIVDSNQNEQTIARSYGLFGSFDTLYTIKSISIGGGLLLESQGETTIGGVKQRDGFLSYSYRLFLKLGNLNQLENGAVDWPWECQVRFQDVFRGNNVDHQTDLNLSILLYF